MIKSIVEIIAVIGIFVSGIIMFKSRVSGEELVKEPAGELHLAAVTFFLGGLLPFIALLSIGNKDGLFHSLIFWVGIHIVFILALCILGVIDYKGKNY